MSAILTKVEQRPMSFTLPVVGAAGAFAGIFVGADAMSRAAQVPSYIADVMVATALLTMVVAILMTRFRIRWK